MTKGETHTASGGKTNIASGNESGMAREEDYSSRGKRKTFMSPKKRAPKKRIGEDLQINEVFKILKNLVEPN